MSQSPLIAVVEDDESLRESVVGLVSLGYRTSAWESADAFLAAGQAAACDCIITDIQMPGASGIDLKLALTEAGCAVPVIMVTARTEAALHDRARASGAVCLLKKPFAAEALIECLESALAA